MGGSCHAGDRALVGRAIVAKSSYLLLPYQDSLPVKLSGECVAQLYTHTHSLTSQSPALIAMTQLRQFNLHHLQKSHRETSLEVLSV